MDRRRRREGRTSCLIRYCVFRHVCPTLCFFLVHGTTPLRTRHQISVPSPSHSTAFEGASIRICCPAYYRGMQQMSPCHFSPRAGRAGRAGRAMHTHQVQCLSYHHRKESPRAWRSADPKQGGRNTSALKRRPCIVGLQALGWTCRCSCKTCRRGARVRGRVRVRETIPPTAQWLRLDDSGVCALVGLRTDCLVRA
ncbi:hypothetical protein F5883DRAFT_612046 [Diaporthe sp. PMI_573]|nr:hypothetical protein F5883DRAFT_612046 [Diaporthaceae sp. PMI_573]